MSFELAVRVTEIMLAFAFLQQSVEHLSVSKRDYLFFLLRIVPCILLVLGLYTPWACLALVINALFILHRFQGPYNGGSDRMGLLILCCLCLVYFMPSQQWREIVFGYLAVQLVLSYFISGFVKIVNVEWRSGRALNDVFLFSAYPASEGIRAWAKKPRLLFVMSWAVIVFELIFPFSLLTQESLFVALVVAALFHLGNVFLFGLNRFFWIWLAAYPSLIWLQGRLFEVGGGV